MKHTLFYVQGQKDDKFNLEEIILEEINKLRQMGLVQETNSDEENSSSFSLDVTVLGRATYKGRSVPFLIYFGNEGILRKDSCGEMNFFCQPL